MSGTNIDDAADTADFFLDVALKNATSARGPALRATGFCLNCREPLDAGQPFCDADCRDDWEKRNRR